MAVAALSTSAIALASGSTPAPAMQGAAPAPEAFAKLVQRAKPDEKPAQDGATPEGSTEGETETAVGSDDGARATPEGETPDVAAGSSADLLARINAMVEAASQIGISVPAPVVAPVPSIAPAPVPVAITTAEAAPATAQAAVATAPTPALPVIKTAPAAASIAAPQAAPGTSTVQPAPAIATAPEAEPDTVRAAAGTEAARIETPHAEAAEIVRPAVLQKGSDIAQLLASLRTAFAAVETKEPAAPGPTSAPASIAAPVPAEITAPQPAAIATATAPAPVIAEAVLPEPAIIASIAGAEAPVAASEPVVTPIVTASPADESTISAVPKTPEAPAAAVASAAKAGAPIEAALLDLPSVDTDQPTVPADIAVAPEADAPADTAEAPAAPMTVATDTAAPLATAAPSAPATVPAATADGTEPVTEQVDQIVNRELDLMKDHQWLDRLARDISQAATRDGQLRFQLNPEHLGALTVEIANSAAGTAIRMTADSDQARSIIADAQPRLLAEVRAQGLRVAETHVDLNQQQSNGGSTSAQAQQQQQQQQNRQSSEDSKPFVRTQTGIRDDADDSAKRDTGELYA